MDIEYEEDDYDDVIQPLPSDDDDIDTDPPSQDEDRVSGEHDSDDNAQEPTSEHHTESASSSSSESSSSDRSVPSPVPNPRISHIFLYVPRREQIPMFVEKRDRGPNRTLIRTFDLLSNQSVINLRRELEERPPFLQVSAAPGASGVRTTRQLIQNEVVLITIGICSSSCVC